MPNALRMSVLSKEAKRFGLRLVQLPYPPGGYAVELPALTTTVVGVDGEKYDRAPAIWCRNLVEAASAIQNRPRVSKRSR